MAQTAAHLVDHLVPRVLVRQRVLSFPIALRIVFAAHPELLSPMSRIIQRVIARFPIKQAGLKHGESGTGAVTLIQRFGSAANLNIYVAWCAMAPIGAAKACRCSMRCVPPPSSSCNTYSSGSSRAS